MGENINTDTTTYIYTYTCHEEEIPLCQLEKRMMFGVGTEDKIIESTTKVDPSRSPFIKERVEVLFKGEAIEDLIEKVKGMKVSNFTFKVKLINHSQYKLGFDERRHLERKFGLVIPGKADLNHPEVLYAVLKLNGNWVFGYYIENKSIWYLHQKKPYQYSTALSTRVARAVVNIAIPDPTGIKAIDPCCGIGTVLIEALSMGIDICGSDNNPLVMKGARGNIAHFGLEGQVKLLDIRDVKGNYDVAIIDLPYNLCSVITAEEQLEMLQSAREFSTKVVIVTIETIDKIIKQAGFKIKDRCIVKKGNFSRQILVCE